MKVTNWSRKIRVAILAAAGVWTSSSAYAIDLPLGDPSFEDYPVAVYDMGGDGYAYADLYVSQSEWIDDLNGAGFPADYVQSDGSSNWLYEVTYGEAGPNIYRPAPRTGVQAMHGNADPNAGHYNAQITGNLFEANRTYKFSIYAQNDFGGDDTEGVFMYIFDGSEDFSDADSLARNGGVAFTAANGDFNERLGGMDQEDSEGNWRRISVSHYVAPGAPEIGSPIGVGFFLRDDTAVDDAKLQVAPLLRLEVNLANGDVSIVNQSGQPVPVDYYEITSANSSLNANNIAWESIEDQGDVDGFPAGDGSGNGWEEFGNNTSSKIIGESNPSGHSFVPTTTEGIYLGDAFREGFQPDLIFRYGVLLDTAVPDGDFNNDGVVDGADYVMWRKQNGPQADYQDWVENFGEATGPGGASTLVRGEVVYIPGPGSGGTTVPEPAVVLLVGLGIAMASLPARRRAV